LGFRGIQAGALLTEEPGVVQWLTFTSGRQGGEAAPNLFGLRRESRRAGATPLWKPCPQSKSGVAAALCHRSPKSSRRTMILTYCREAITRPVGFQNCPAEPAARVNVCRKQPLLLPVG